LLSALGASVKELLAVARADAVAQRMALLALRAPADRRRAMRTACADRSGLRVGRT
jgi:hypothetical protein